MDDEVAKVNAFIKKEGERKKDQAAAALKVYNEKIKAVKDQHTKFHTANKAYQAAAKAVAENKDPKKAGDLEGKVAAAKQGLEDH